MKIIAKTKHGFLVDATADELARVRGKMYDSSFERPLRAEEGMTIDVSEAWRDLADFQRARSRIEDAAKTLRAVADIAETCSAAYIKAEE